MIRVVLADDHAMVRRGLEQLLNAEPDVEVVGMARDGAEAIELVAQTSPDVVLMDLQMPVVDGVAATKQITGSSETVVVVLTSFSDSERILAAIDAGAVGYLLKDAEPEHVIEGLRAAARGESPLHPRAARQLLTARSSSASVELTPRERQVLALVRGGLANKQIARRLDISERTVKAHLTSVFQRIGVVDRTQAAVWAERHSID